MLKRLGLCCITYLLCHCHAHAQIIDTSDYKVAFLVDSNLVDMSGATIVLGPENTTTDTVSGMLPIGFNFYYMGRQYDSVSVNEFGFLAFGNMAAQLSNNYLNNDTMAYPILAPYWTNVFTGMDGGVLAETFGTAPNRYFVVRWNVVVPPGGSGTYLGVIQLTLHEENNRIEYKYVNRPGYSTGGLPQPADQAFAGESSGIKDFVNGGSGYIKCSFSSFFYSSFTNYNVNANITNNINISNGGTVLFYADSSSNSAPINFSCTPAPAQVIVNFTDNSTAEDIFKIYRSADSIHFNELRTIRSATKGSTGTVYTFTDTFGIQFGTTYYYRIVASALGGAPSPYLSGTAPAAPALLGGIKTIPGDYATLTAAIQDIYHKYLTGPIILELQQNYDTSYETFPIVIDSRLYNASAVNTVTIQPAANVSTPVAVITRNPHKLNWWQTFGGTNYLTINGAPGGTGNNKMLQIGQLWMEDTAYGISLLNTMVQGVTSYYNGLQNLTVKHCAFDSSSILIAATNTGVDIDSNDFFNLGGAAIYVQPGASCSNLRICHNNFYRIKTQEPSGIGVIYVFDTISTSIFTVDSNFIGGDSAGAMGAYTSVQGYTGISLRVKNTSTVNVLGNTLRQVYINGAFSNYGGIYAVGGNTDIENNVIGDSTAFTINCGPASGITLYTQNDQKDIVSNNMIAGIISTQFSGISYNETFGPVTRYSYIENNIVGCKSQYQSVQTSTFNTSGIDVFATGHVLVRHNSIINLNSPKSVWGSAYQYANGLQATGDVMLVSGNTIDNVDGIGLTAGSTNLTNNIVVEHNIIKNFWNVGIGTGTFSSPLVNANIIYTAVDTDATGITTAGGLVTNNFICLGYDSSGGLIEDHSNTGIALEDQTVTQVINNTIVLDGDSTPIMGLTNAINFGIEFDNGSQQEGISQNNIIVDLVPPKSVGVIDDEGIEDYNAPVETSHDFFYAPYDTAFYTSPYPDNLAIRYTNPLLVYPYGPPDSINLHVQTGSAAAGAVPANALVTTDIDGNIRPLTGNVTAGAHELDPLVVVNYHTPPVISYTPIPDTTVAALSLAAVISDSTLIMSQYSASPPYMYYTRQGSGNWLQVAGNLVSGNLQSGGWNFAFPNSFLEGLSVGDTVQYFVTAQDVWGNLATHATGGSGISTAFIDTVPANPDFFVFEGYIYSPALTLYPELCTGNTTVYVVDTTHMNLTGNNVLFYYKINNSGAYQPVTAGFVSGNANSNTWSVGFNLNSLTGLLPNDTVYYFAVAQDNNATNTLASTPVGAAGPNIFALTAFPPQPYYYVVPQLHYPQLQYTPFTNESITLINIPLQVTVTVNDTTTPNVSNSNNMVCYYKENTGGSYLSTAATLTYNSYAGYSTWQVQLNLTNLTGLAIGDTVYYFVAMQDENCINLLNSLPAGAAGATVYQLTAYPPSPWFFVITGPVPHITASIGSNCPDSLFMQVEDTLNMNLTGNNAAAYYKINAAGNYNMAPAAFITGTANNNEWVAPLGVDSLAGDTVYYFAVAQDGNSPNHLASAPTGAAGTSISSLTAYPPNPYHLLVPKAYYPQVQYTPPGNVAINQVGTPLQVNVMVSDWNTMDLSGGNNVRCYYKVNAQGAYSSSAAGLLSGNGSSSAWLAQINLQGTGSLAAGDTVYYFITAEDALCPNRLASWPAGAAGASVQQLTAYPPSPGFFLITDSVTAIPGIAGAAAEMRVAYTPAGHALLLTGAGISGSYRVRDILGQALLAAPLSQSQILLDDNLAPGVYVVSVISTGQTILGNIKFVVAAR